MDTNVRVDCRDIYNSSCIFCIFSTFLECNDNKKALKHCAAGKKCMAVIRKRRRSRLQCVPKSRSGDRPGYTIPRDESQNQRNKTLNCLKTCIIKVS